MKRYLVTGGAGYIGSHIVDRLLDEGHEVIAYDNMSTGQLKFLDKARDNLRFTLIEDTILNQSALIAAMHDVDTVFHFAANADVKGGWAFPQKDLYDNTVGTSNVLEAMRLNECTKIIFASTSAVYGDPVIHPTPENPPTTKQTSLYGATKMAAEGLISSYCEAGLIMTGIAFRFVTVLGPRYPHGFVYDFVRNLRQNPNILPVFGNGTAIKSSLNIRDCLDALFLLGDQNDNVGFDVYNIGVDETYTVNQAIDWVCQEMQLNPEIKHLGTTARGWPGDSVHLHLDISKARAAGWQPKYGVEQTIRETTNWVKNNTWLFDVRK